jgi:hypothetical protein
MSAMEKSDLPVVARKRANKAASAAAEPVERRDEAKENADLRSTVRTLSREAVSQAQGRSSRPHGGVSSAAVTPEVHTEGEWQTAAARHRCNEDKIVQAAVAAALTPIY